MRRRWPKVLLAVLLGLAAVLVAARLALDPFLASRLRRGLAHMSEGKRGTFRTLHVRVADLTMMVDDLRITKPSAQGRATPFFEARQVKLGLYWRELLHGHLVASITLDRPKLSLVTSRRPEEKQKPEETIDLGKLARGVSPLRIDRAEAKDGEVLWVDAEAEGRPELWLHAIGATLENFATRDALAKGEPSILALSGTLQRTGKLSLFASADPLAKSATFAGQARLEGLHLRELGQVLSATAGLTPTKGTLDISARFKAEDGVISGGVRPVLKDPDVKPAKPGLGAKLKAALADLSIDLLSDRVPGRNAVATTIPIHGRVTSPGTQVWPTVLGVVRNAFVTGLTDSLTNLPPHGGSGQRGQGAAARRPPQRGGRPSGGASP